VTNYFVDMAHLPIYFEVARPLCRHQSSAGLDGHPDLRSWRADGALFEIEAIAVVPQK